MSHTPGPISFHYEEEVDWGRLPCPPLKTTLYVMMTKDRHNALMAQRADLLAACEATCAAIEFRGKALLAGYDELDEDESNWRDGVEPYLLELYEQNRAIVKAAEGDE